jgi:hypothetical protein
MKKKNRKRDPRRRTARLEVLPVHTKRRGAAKKTKKVENASTPWLRVLSSGIDDEPAGLRESFSRRNGRRQSPDVDLYVPEHKSRSR